MEAFKLTSKERHKLFVCFYHRDDEAYRNEFRRQFSSDYISKSVELGDINEDNSDRYVKRLIAENFIADASVVVVLIGPNTRYRKHVDWEISAGLEPTSGRSGLVGILLPTIPSYSGGSYNPLYVPPRLQDNLETGYASIYWWSQINGNRDALVNIVNDAFERRTHDDRARNGRPQRQRNTEP